MSSWRWPVTMITRVAPACSARRTLRSRSVVPSSGVSGLQAEEACNREPRPAARITASMSLSRNAQRDRCGEGFDFLKGLTVRHLARRMLAEVRGRRLQNAALLALQGQFGAADHIDGDTGRVGRIFHRKSQLQIHGHVAEERAFHAQEADLVVLLPGDVVRRTHMDV